MQLPEQQIILFQSFLFARLQRLIGRFQFFTSLLDLRHPDLELLQLRASRLFGPLELLLCQEHLLKLFLHHMQLRP